MNKTVIVEPTADITEGMEFHVFSNKLHIGDNVEIRREYKGIRGRVIATGKIVANGSDDPRASVPYPQNGNANAWKHYWKVHVEEVL